jgi:hypothetical protein
VRRINRIAPDHHDPLAVTGPIGPDRNHRPQMPQTGMAENTCPPPESGPALIYLALLFQMIQPVPEGCRSADLNK